MKRIILALTLFTLVSTTSAFANDWKTNPIVVQAFQNTFTTAKDVAWSEQSGLYKVSFTLNEQHVIAFYSIDGEMKALTRNITTMQLPVTLQAELKRSYTDYWVSDLFEMTGENGTSYYITLETADAKVVLQSSSSNGWSTYQKTKKS